MCVIIGDDYTAFRGGGGVSTHFHVLCNETKIWLDIDCSIYTLDENHLFLYRGISQYFACHGGENQRETISFAL